MEQKNIQSTNTIEPDLPLSFFLDIHPTQELLNVITDSIYCTMTSTTTISNSYSNQTGKFLIKSSRVYQYIFVLYDYNSNSILTRPLKTRQASEINKAWTEYTFLTTRHLFISYTSHIGQ